jgi:nicotinic acid phosphoribosyltransferase
VIGGCAHLLSFAGSDTMSACYYAQHVLNKGVPVGFSIPATEHSVMTSWEDELKAIENLCEKFEGGMVSAVLDAYDYDRMLTTGLPYLKATVIRTRCTLIARPDSGDPVEQVIKALKAAYNADYPMYKNKKGYIQFENFAVLQGDGINYKQVKKILESVLEEGFSAVNVAFGMGGGLLQKVDRDTMSFATKLCYMQDGAREIQVIKKPKGQEGKMSLGGKMTVLHEHRGNKISGPHFLCTEEEAKNLIESDPTKYAKSMKVVYDGTITADEADALEDIKEFQNETFEDVKNRLLKEWPLTIIPPVYHESIVKSQAKIQKEVEERHTTAFARIEKEANPSQRPTIERNPGVTIRANLQSPNQHTIDPTPTLKDSSQLLLDTLDRLL